MSKTKSADYHDEMNGKHFTEWFEKQLLPNIPPQSVIILDNAPYHNVVVEKIPTKSSRKGDMQEWLRRHEIEIDSKDLKKDLFEKIQKEASQKRFVVDDLAREKNAHCSSISCSPLRTEPN